MAHTFDAQVVEARRAYFRAWRAANKDKVREHNRRYWEKVAAKRMQEQSKNNVGKDDNR